MKLNRLLLIPEMKWFGRFLISLSLFGRMWLKSRSVSRLAWAAPALVLTVTFVWAVSVSWMRSHDPTLLEEYLILARQAVADGHVADARLLFRRAQLLAPGDQGISAELATSLFHLGERSEAYQLLSSIAPVQKTGHLPAHRFLVQNPPELPPAQQDYFRAVHLSHLVRNSAETRAERVQLLHILAQYRQLDDVETLIRDALDRYPEDRLFLAQLKFRNGDKSGALRETEEACRVFTLLIQQDPGNVDRRIHLAQGYVFLKKFADAICVICEGMVSPDIASINSLGNSKASTGVPDADASTKPQKSLPIRVTDDTRKLAPILGNIYFAWMTTLPANEQAIQLRCLQRMLTQSTDASADSDIESPEALNGKMQIALTSPEHVWVLAAIEGNARVALGQWSAAEQTYRLALQSAPEDPTLANNLAWLLLRKARSLSVDPPDFARQQILKEALQQSRKAVEQMPEIVSFLETRGQIQAEIGNHAAALLDLTECLNRGKDTPEIQRTIEACTPTSR